MEITRKEFLGTVMGAAAAPLVDTPVAGAQALKKQFSLGVTLYSFNDEFYRYKYSFEDCMQKAGALGPGTGIELVGPQMMRSWPEVSEEFEKTFKRLVEKYELRPIAYGGYEDIGRTTGRFLTDDENAEYIRVQIRSAKRLGFPISRIGIIRGDRTERSTPVAYAEKLGVKIGIEIHCPNTIESPKAQKDIEVVKRINSPFFGFVPDCGTFASSCANVYIEKFTQMGVPTEIRKRVVQLWEERTPLEKMYADIAAMGGDDLARLMVLESNRYFGHGEPKAMKEVMPHIIHVHGKFFGIDPKTGDEPSVRYPEIVSVLKEGGFNGCMVSEYEGHHWMGDRDAFLQIKSHHALIRRLLDKA
jgi:hypothetical protein